MGVKKRALTCFTAILAVIIMLISAGCPDDDKSGEVTVSGDEKPYRVTVQAGITNGTISASATKAAMGDTITLTITPDNKYFLGSLSVKQAGSVSVVTWGPSGKREFIMPASDVTVSGIFEALAENTTVIHFEGFYEESIDLSRNHKNDFIVGSTQTLRIEAPKGYDSYYWYIKGKLLSDESNVYTLAMNADIWDANAVGIHTITVVVEKDARFYSKDLTFRVVLR